MKLSLNTQLCHDSNIPKVTTLTSIKYVFITARGWTNVYIRSIGCFKDKPRRAAGSMVANLRGLKFVVRDCARQARKRGYRLFAVQNGGECFMGPRAKITYKKYGPSKRCRGGKGGPWANNVYIIVVKGRFLDFVGIILSKLYGSIYLSIQYLGSSGILRKRGMNSNSPR